MTKEEAFFEQHVRYKGAALVDPDIGFHDEPDSEQSKAERAEDRLKTTAGLQRLDPPKIALIKLAALRYETDPDTNALPVGKCAEALGVSRMTFHRMRAAVGVSLRAFLCKTG
jgi:hypothetical protein